MKVMFGWVTAIAATMAATSCSVLPKLSTGTPANTSSPGAGNAVVFQDEVTSGIETADMLGAEPPSVRVSWIRWDSGFRDTDLRIGDQIVAVNGERYVKPADIRDLQRMLPKVIGGRAEVQHWKERGARDGTEITLAVRRRAANGIGTETVTIRGKLRAQRIYQDNSRRRIGPGGPDEMSTDGFERTWSGWYEAQTRNWERVLDRGWTLQQVNSRVALADHLAEKARVDYLVARHPGPFATSVKADWERVRDSLVGRRYPISDRDLQYRRLGEQRAKEIAATALRARESFIARVKADTIVPFPTIDPIRGDRTKVAGKIVVLPEIGTRGWISEAGHNYLAVGDRGWYFIDLEKPEARRMFAATARYQKYVQPQIAESYAIIGRVEPNPKMIVTNGRAVTGLEVVPVATTIGGAAFVDLSIVKGGLSLFAGEEALNIPRLLPLKDSATPSEVVQALVAAMKAGEEGTWKGLYATWQAENWKEQGVLYHPHYQRQLDEEWIRGRRLILDRVYDVVPIYVSDPKRILTGKEFPGAPVIEEVLVEVDHVGKFDGEYHAFTDVNVHRVWGLQRRDGGPWRITSGHGL